MGNRAVKACSLRSCAYCMAMGLGIDAEAYCELLPRRIPDKIVDALKCPGWCPDLSPAERQMLGATCGERVMP